MRAMWCLVAPLLALAVLGAHFFRAGSIALVMSCLARLYAGEPTELPSR